MKCTFVLVISLACLALALGQQDCEAEQDAFRACIHEGKPDRAEMKETINLCLQKAQCDSLPELGAEKVDTEEGDSEPAEQSSRNELHECIRTVKDQVKVDLTACVQVTNPLFQLPEQSEKHHGGGYKSKGGRAGRHAKSRARRGGRRGASSRRGEKGGNGFVQSMVERLCANGGDAEAALACVLSNIPDKLVEADWQVRKEQMQQKKEECLAENVSAACQQQREDEKATLCSCAQDPALNEALQQGIEQCRVQLFGEAAPQAPRRSFDLASRRGKGQGGRRRSGSRRGGRGKRRAPGGRRGGHYRGGQNLAEKFCSEQAEDE